jgi:hypothetical protein
MMYTVHTKCISTNEIIASVDVEVDGKISDFVSHIDVARVLLNKMGLVARVKSVGGLKSGRADLNYEVFGKQYKDTRWLAVRKHEVNVTTLPVENNVRTIDVTPSWRTAVQIHIHCLQTAAAPQRVRDDAASELLRLADYVDSINANKA